MQSCILNSSITTSNNTPNRQIARHFQYPIPTLVLRIVGIHHRRHHRKAMEFRQGIWIPRLQQCVVCDQCPHILRFPWTRNDEQVPHHQEEGALCLQTMT